MNEVVAAAVDAALAAGAGDAEAFATEAGEREVRVHGGEVESLTAATQRGIGLRAWIGNRVGFAFGTDLGEPGAADLARRAVEAPRAGADNDEGEIRKLLYRVGFAFGALEGDEHPASNLRGLLDRLQAGRELLPLGMAKVTVPRSAREDQVVVGQLMLFLNNCLTL